MSSLAAALAITVGLAHSQYVDQATPGFSLKLEVAHEDSPVYLWAGYEIMGIRMLGQEVSKTGIFSVGLGARKNVGDFFVFGEIGFGALDNVVDHGRQQEVVYTELVSRHNVYNRPVPLSLKGPYDQTSYETLWELKEGPLGRVGGGYQFGPHLSATVSFRPFFVKEHIELWDEDKRGAGGGWWQESRTRNLSSWEFGVRYTF